MKYLNIYLNGLFCSASCIVRGSWRPNVSGNIIVDTPTIAPLKPNTKNGNEGQD